MAKTPAKPTNDDTILGLRTEIAKRKEALGVAKRFSPLTNCLLVVDGARYNLNTLDADGLVMTMVRLNVLRMSAQDLRVTLPKVDGFSIGEWIEDCRSRLAILERREQERQLSVYESRLHTLLSADKKIELELDSIADALR